MTTNKLSRPTVCRNLAQSVDNLLTNHSQSLVCLLSINVQIRRMTLDITIKDNTTLCESVLFSIQLLHLLAVKNINTRSQRRPLPGHIHIGYILRGVTSSTSSFLIGY